MLNQDAGLLLLRLIEVNGGRIGRGDFTAAVHQMTDIGTIKVKFTPEIPSNMHSYDYLLTEKGSQVLDAVQEKKKASLGVTVLKEKNGRPTVIEHQGRRYVLQQEPANAGKNWADQIAPDTKF